MLGEETRAAMNAQPSANRKKQPKTGRFQRIKLAPGPTAIRSRATQRQRVNNPRIAIDRSFAMADVFRDGLKAQRRPMSASLAKRLGLDGWRRCEIRYLRYGYQEPCAWRCVISNASESVNC
jgi:hypothetical protein